MAATAIKDGRLQRWNSYSQSVYGGGFAFRVEPLVEERTAASYGANPALSVGIQRNPFMETPSISISVSRSFPSYKEVAFVFRVDALNLPNHTNLSNPGTSLGLTTDATHAFTMFRLSVSLLDGPQNRFLQIVTD